MGDCCEAIEENGGDSKVKEEEKVKVMPWGAVPASLNIMA